LTPLPTATPDTCLARDFLLAFDKPEQQFVTPGKGKATVRIENRGTRGAARDLVLRLVVIEGKEYVQALSFSLATKPDAATSESLELRLADLGPAASREIAIAYAVDFTVASADSLTAVKAPASNVVLAVEVVGEACRPANQAPGPVARLVLTPAVKTLTPVLEPAVQADVSEAPSVQIGGRVASETKR
jgi:hypothetical protein